jgi:hypothetical protein
VACYVNGSIISSLEYRPCLPLKFATTL